MQTGRCLAFLEPMNISLEFGFSFSSKKIREGMILMNLNGQTIFDYLVYQNLLQSLNNFFNL